MKRPPLKAAAAFQPEPEINVTPLVDVMLVLLIIFMVITPTLAEGADLELPAFSAVDPKPKDLEPIDIALLRDGSVLIDKKPIAEAELEGRLRELHAADEKKRAMLKADRAVPYRRVRETFARIQNVGFRGVALRVSKRDDGKDGA
ncbi:MAG: biopolymer transporter ExbD [Deltaproteobacteria bacterium]|nr:biopolymer transporter ExbD [Deltaproteobacteria bacterium]